MRAAGRPSTSCSGGVNPLGVFIHRQARLCLLSQDTRSALATEEGKKSGIPIFEAMAAAIAELSRLPGMRVLIIIAEGNDYGSSMGYKGLRDLVQARSVTCLVALVDDHPTRGTKSILRYGWSLQDLASDTAGTFVENTKRVARTAARFGEMVASFRLVTLEIAGLPPGRHRVSVSSPPGLRLHAQKAILTGTAVLGPETE